MSLSNTSIDDVDAIKHRTATFVQFWSYLLISFGMIGHSLNIFVFSRPTLRSNPCVRYFLASTACGTFIVLIVMPLRLLQLVYSIDVFAYSTASCKILQYLAFSSKALASWFIVLASLDRFLSSSRTATTRGWSTIRVSSRLIFVMTIIVGLFYIYVPIQYQIRDGHSRCSTNQSNPPTFNGIWTFIILSISPSLLMLTFGSLTIRNVRQSSKRIKSQSGTQNELQQQHLQRQKTTDRQMMQMMIVQCIYYSVLTTPLSINWIYTSARDYVSPTALQNAKDEMFVYISGYLSNTCACTSFYLFTLSSKLFRRELMYLFRSRSQINNITNRNPTYVIQKN